MTDTGTYDIQLFENAEFGELTVLTFEDSGDTVWFIGNEVATMLGYKLARKAINDHVDSEDKNTVPIRNGNQKGNPNKVIINESGLYSLILSSKLPSAKKFKRWVTSDVLPSIRKHGAYMTEETLEKALTSPDFLIQLATKLKDEQEKNKRLTQANEELTLTNAALVEKVNTWDKRAIITALVRHWGGVCRNGDLEWAWKSIYKKLYYTLGISVYSRKNRKKNSWLDVLTDDELTKALKVVAATCEGADINVGRVVGETNAKLIANLPDLVID